MPSLLQHIKPFKNNRVTIKHNQSTNDIISGILITHNLHKSDYDKICMQFNARSTENICKKIYNYLSKNTIYKIESDDKQTLRSPAAILTLGAKKNIGLDCKSYALFSAGILDALKRRGKDINWCFRFASYKIYDKIPHHVFIVINPNTNNEIWLDNVFKPFNNHKQYFHKIDKMALIAIAGIGGKNRRNRKNAVKGKLKERLKKGGKLLIKFNPATVSARNSFLLMVKLNIFGLARNLAKVQLMKPKELYRFWNKIGGNTKNLDKAINVGKNKGHHKASAAGVGFVPAIAAAIAAATPIVVKIGALLKSCGIDTSKLAAAAKKVISKVADRKIDQFAEYQVDKEDSGEDSGEFNSSGADESSESADDNNDGGGADESSDDSGEEINGVFYPALKNNLSARSIQNKMNRFNTSMTLRNLKPRRFI